jgi:hypothetical protein
VPGLSLYNDESGHTTNMTGNTGGGGRTVGGIGYVVTPYGFIYRVGYGGDPYGYIVYANQFGFQDSDGLPLYHDVMAEPSAATQDQNELRELQGGVQLLPPEYPIFFDQPDGPTLGALGIEAALGPWPGQHGIFINDGKATSLPFAEQAPLILERVHSIYNRAFLTKISN